MASQTVEQIFPRLEPTAPPMRQPPALYDELLEKIFLRVASPIDLARASAACTSFRRLIADPTFLRLYRSIHRPILLGVLCDGFQPAESPHPNAPAARALAHADGFAFDYLPPGRWQYCYVSDGRVLLQCAPDYGATAGVYFPDLAVCDPLSRRYLLLPRIPDDLVASVLQVQEHKIHFEAYLVPSRYEEGTSFRVIVRTHSIEKLVIFILSSSSSSWSVGTSWVDLGFDSTPSGIVLGWPQYKNGCFYWKLNSRAKLLKLDINTMEFFTMDLPPSHGVRDVVIAEDGEGRLAMLSLLGNGTCVYYYTIRENEDERAHVWPLVEKIAPLPCPCHFVGASEGYIFLVGLEDSRNKVDAVCFTLEIKTMKIERLTSLNYLYVHVHSYFGYLPFLSARRI